MKHLVLALSLVITSCGVLQEEEDITNQDEELVVCCRPPTGPWNSPDRYDIDVTYRLRMPSDSQLLSRSEHLIARISKVGEDGEPDQLVHEQRVSYGSLYDLDDQYDYYADECNELVTEIMYEGIPFYEEDFEHYCHDPMFDGYGLTILPDVNEMPVSDIPDVYEMPEVRQNESTDLVKLLWEINDERGLPELRLRMRTMDQHAQYTVAVFVDRNRNGQVNTTDLVSDRAHTLFSHHVNDLEDMVFTSADNSQTFTVTEDANIDVLVEVSDHIREHLVESDIVYLQIFADEQQMSHRRLLAKDLLDPRIITLLQPNLSIKADVKLTVFIDRDRDGQQSIGDILATADIDLKSDMVLTITLLDSHLLP